MRDKTVSAILAHAAASPRSAVAWLFRRGGWRNTSPAKIMLSRRLSNLNFPEDYAAAEEQGTVVAIVHSHPGDGRQPSRANSTC
jgi:proteasome lid subunit RPN8/RPN11